MEDPHKGHRDRLRARFLRSDGEGLEDYELLELLLFYAVPRRDTNLLAHMLIGKFSTFKGVLSADVKELCEVKGISTSSAVMIKAVTAAAKRFFTEDADSRPLLANVGRAAEYIVKKFYGVQEEQFCVLCLNVGFRLIGMERIGRGDAGSVAVSPRAVVKTALNKNAAYVILAHNHPGGTPRPSLADIELTQQLSGLLSSVGIKVCDHIITSDSEFYSFLKHSAFSVGDAKMLLSAEQYGG